MLDFRPPVTEDRKWVAPIISHAKRFGCDYSFGDMFIWQHVYNIRIASHVGRVDAWLISSGDIVTCAQSASGVLITNPSFITQASCGGSLRVNGPIISNNLKSWRTGGSDIGNLDTPSEIYNQRPDTYIWAYGQSGGDGKIITTYSKELPARF